MALTSKLRREERSEIAPPTAAHVEAVKTKTVKKKTAGHDEQLFIAIDSFSHGEWLIKRGWRLRRSHPCVRACPNLFRLWPETPDDELEDARRALSRREPVEVES